MNSKVVADEGVDGDERCEGKEVDENERHGGKITPPLFKINDHGERGKRKGKGQRGE